MKNKNILQALTGIFVVSVLMIGALSIAPLAHAQEFGDGSDGGCCGSDTGWYDVGSGYTPTDTGTGWYDVGSGYTPTDNTGWYDVGSGYTPSYSTSGYSTGGYSTGGYSTGGYSIGGYGYSTGGSSNSSVYAPTTVTTNNNTCTNNSCNTNISNPAPVINNVVTYAPTQTQYCAAGYYGTYPNCYLNQPVVYNTATPYVSLTQVPYTGLDLGFWGTVSYWGAMVLFALVVAYLIVIKRVQNVIALRLKYFLFGTTGTEEHEEVVVAHAPVVSKVYATVPTNEDIVDSFILSQINRPRRA
ncbi:MAG TPA: hypothetical protein VMR46_03415 [Candidatus Paceibacterota bacterium]|nr:hypothetical protein [Candidatus Paceibacterota bacterium]